MGAFMSLPEPNSPAAIFQFAIEIMPPAHTTGWRNLR
jgi:hypothetical protein